MFRKACALISLALCASLPLAGPRTATADASRVADCPEVSIREVVGGGGKYVLGAAVVGGHPAIELTFKWCISAGEITRGQGTSEIEIDAAGVSDRGITVTVIVGGFAWGCDDVAVYRIDLRVTPQPLEAPPFVAPPNNGMHPAANHVGCRRLA